jgi:hypothetical protein
MSSTAWPGRLIRSYPKHKRAFPGDVDSSTFYHRLLLLWCSRLNFFLSKILHLMDNVLNGHVDDRCRGDNFPCWRTRAASEIITDVVAIPHL